jgi:Xaa-Pro aminopeptidase
MQRIDADRVKRFKTAHNAAAAELALAKKAMRKAEALHAWTREQFEETNYRLYKEIERQKRSNHGKSKRA